MAKEIKIYNLQEVVEKYGTEAHKEAIIRMKGNLRGKHIETLLKTLKQYYEQVEVQGRGKKRIFICSGRHEIVQKRINNYANCGRKTPYKEILTVLILKCITESKSHIELPLNEWLLRIGAVDRKLIERNFYAPESAYLRKNDFQELIDCNILDEDQRGLLDHYIDREIGDLRNALEAAFKDLDKKGIIYYQIGRTGRIADTSLSMEEDERHICFIDRVENGEIYREMSRDEVYEIGLIEAKLQNKYNLTPAMIYLYRHDEKVKEYKQELRNILISKFNVSYTFRVHSASIRASDRAIQAYMDKCLEKIDDAYNQFRVLYQEHSLNLAKNREQKAMKDKKKLEKVFYDVVAEAQCNGKYSTIWEKLQEFYGMK